MSPLRSGLHLIRNILFPNDFLLFMIQTSNGVMNIQFKDGKIGIHRTGKKASYMFEG